MKHLLARVILWAANRIDPPHPRPVVDWGCSCGRTYLTVDGYVVAMEGDVLRDMDLGLKKNELLEAQYGKDELLMKVFGQRDCWTGELIKFVATEANGGKLP